MGLRCSKCGRPRQPEDFRQSSPGHLRTVCKRCEYDRDNERYAEERGVPVQPRRLRAPDPTDPEFLPEDSVDMADIVRENSPFAQGNNGKEGDDWERYVRMYNANS